MAEIRLHKFQKRQGVRHEHFCSLITLWFHVGVNPYVGSYILSGLNIFAVEEDMDGNKLN